MQALNLMGAEAGKTIFISGGTGGVGGMAIPIAKAKGLTVITNGAGASGERVLAWLVASLTRCRQATACTTISSS